MIGGQICEDWEGVIQRGAKETMPDRLAAARRPGETGSLRATPGRRDLHPPQVVMQQPEAQLRASVPARGHPQPPALVSVRPGPSDVSGSADPQYYRRPRNATS